MSAESTNEQEQLRIEENETMQEEEGTYFPKLSKSDSSCSISSESENISQDLKKSVDVEVGITTEQVCCSNKVHSDSPTELSDEYIIEMLKNLNDRRIAMDEGILFDADKQNLPPLQEASISNESEKADNGKKLDNLEFVVEDNDNTDENSALKKKSRSIDSHIEKDNERGSMDENKTENNDDIKETSCLKEKSIAIDLHTEKDNDNQSMDKNKTEKNGDIKKTSCLKEKSTTIDSHTEENNGKTSIDENKTTKIDLLSSKELLIIDESNNANDIIEIDEKSSIEKSYDSVKRIDPGKGHQSNNQKISAVVLDNIDMKKAFLPSKLKDNVNTAESDIIIDNIQHMKWLKPTGQESMESNKRRTVRKPLIEKEDCNDDVKEEFDDDTKINTKKKRSNQRKNLKSKIDDSPKQDDKEDVNKKSSEDIGSTDILKSAHGQDMEKFKDTKTAHLPASQRIGIGRGRNDRRKVSLGNSQSRGQIDTNDHRNKSHTCIDILPTTVEKSFSKSEAHSNAQCSSDKVEKEPKSTGDIDFIKPKEQEVCEIKNVSKSYYQDVEFSCNQSSVKNMSESLTQENKGKNDTKQNQSTSENHQNSQNRSATHLSNSRPIHGRSAEKSNSEKVICCVKGFGQGTDESIKNNRSNQSLSSKDNVHRFSEQVNRTQNNNNRGFGQDTDEAFKNNKSSLSSKDSVYRFSEQLNRNQTENKTNQSYSSLLKSKEESSSNKYTCSSKTYDQEFPRWNYNNYPDNQNVKKDEMISHHTSNKHRTITDEKMEKELSLNKNQAAAYKSQGNRRYYDRHQDDNFYGKHFDKNQDNKSSVERYSNRNEDYKSYRDSDTDRSQAVHRDTYFENNRRNRGFGEKFSDGNQDRQYGSSNYSNKFRDGKSSNDRYSDNQQGKTSSERFYNKKNDENEMVTKKEESLNKSPVSFNKNENCSDSNHMTTKSLDSLSKNQGLADKNKSLNSATNSTDSLNKNQVLADKNKSPKSADGSTNIKSQTANKDLSRNYNEKNHQPFDQDNNYKNQDTSNNFEFAHKDRNPSPEAQQMEQFKSNFWLHANQDHKTEKQCKSDVKSQKHFVNTQQAQVQMELNQVQQTHSSTSPVACQQELSSAVYQNFESDGRITSMTDVSAKNQPSQTETWSSYKNTSTQDTVYSSECQNSEPYADVNIACNPTVINEYSLQYNQAILDSSNQFNSTLTSGQKPNVVMAFEGNQNVQRALGIDPRILSQMNNNDPSQSNTTSPTPSQPTYANENGAQFFQSAVADSQLTCIHSTMNVNAQPFEVMKQSNQESNNQQMYVVQQPTVSNQSQNLFGSFSNDFAVDTARIYLIPNDYEEYLKLRKEIFDLSQVMALKQGQLLSLEIKCSKNMSAINKNRLNVINQQSNPAIQQHVCNHNQLAQEPSTYAQVKPSNCPPGFKNVSMNRQNSQLDLYKMLSNVANAQNFTSDSLPSNTALEPKSNVQAGYLNQGNLYQQQTAIYQMYTDKTANSANYIMPQRVEPREIRGVNQFSK